MGRVAKYKKIKSVDPYSKKNGGRVDLSTVGIWGLGNSGRKAKKRSKRSEMLRANKKPRLGSSSSAMMEEQQKGFDLPPGRDEFDLKDLTGSIKKQKVVNPLKETGKKDQDLFAVDRVMVNGNVASIPKTERDEKKAARVLNVREQVKKEDDKKKAKNHGRMEGESKNAYSKRTKVETRQIIKQTTQTKNPEKKQKKKEFLQNKKNKKNKGSASFGSREDERDTRGDDGESDTLITGERAIAMVDQVRFGEQAERPPTFRQLPRGAKEKKDGIPKGKPAKKSANGMTEEQVAAENKSMDMMRRRIQAQYAAIKLQRRRDGDFHL